MGDKNLGGTTAINAFCFERKEYLHSKSQISLPVMIDVEEITHVHPVLKKMAFQIKNSKMCHSREDKWISPSHVTYAFQSESTLYSCLNELFAWSRREIWNLSDYSWTQTHNHLGHKRTLNQIWPNGWVFVNELSGFGFESSCSHFIQYIFHNIAQSFK